MRKQVKPLIVIKVPSRWPQSFVEESRVNFRNSPVANDYYLLILSDDIEEANVKVFYDKDITEKKIEDIQTELLNLINKNHAK